MADFADRASALEELQRDAALARQRTASAAALAGPDDQHLCCDCGLPIEPPRKRVLPHTTRCAQCAAEADLYTTRGARR